MPGGSHPGGISGSLLLGPQTGDASAGIREALEGTEFRPQEIGPVFVVPDVRRRLHEICNLLNERLSARMRLDILAAYAPAGVQNAGEALTAFLFAERLDEVIAKIEYEWVRDALAEDWLFSVFHPILDTLTGQVFGQESLIRARNPHTGQVIGAWPLLQACEALKLQHQLDQRARRCAIRNAADAVPKEQHIFINFLPNTIYDPEICLRTTMETAAACGVDLSRIVFEVVETESIPDMQLLLDILCYYRECGVGTAVDDMGAGFTGLDYITTLCPDFVKLDRELVTSAEHEPGARSKMKDMIALAGEVDAQVIAEGIETPAQHALCLEAGVNLVQGFLFARPQFPPPEILFSPLSPVEGAAAAR